MGPESIHSSRRQKPSMVHEAPPPSPVYRAENEQQRLGLGQLFVQRLSERPLTGSPANLDEQLGTWALLRTNESLSDGEIQKLRRSKNQPDGYIFGVGAGNILSLLKLFPKGEQPKAILCVDIAPEVVVAGRMVVDFLANSGDFLTFLGSLRNEQSIKEAYKRVLASETNKNTSQVFSNINLKTIIDKFNYVTAQSLLTLEIPPRPSNRRVEKKSILEGIQDNFNVYHDLAANGNIGVGFADILARETLDTVQSMPDFNSKKNIIYLSNIIDVLTDRGSRLEHLHDVDALSKLGEGRLRGNRFVDTCSTLDYRLRISDKVPRYSAQDVNEPFSSLMPRLTSFINQAAD